MRAIQSYAWPTRAVRGVAGLTACALVAGLIALMPGASASSSEDRIGFVGDRDGDPEIFTVRPGGGDLVQLTHNQAWDTDPVWSPDATKIAFSSSRDGDDDIWVMNASGDSGAVNLTNSGVGRDVQPEWSRDGTKIIFVRDGQLQMVAAAGGTISPRVRGSAPAWSPTESRVAFVRRGEIHLMSPSGENAAQLTTGQEADAPDWSPDGTRIAFESETATGDTRIKVVDVASGAITELPGAGGDDFHPSWSPDGQSLVFSNITLDAELVVSDAAGQQRTPLASDRAAYEVLPSWSGCVGAGCAAPTASPSGSASPTGTASPTTSPTAPPEKEATRMSLDHVRTRYRIKAAGAVTPKHPNLPMRVALAKRKGGRWVKVTLKMPLMNSDGVFVARFKNPARARRCRLKAVFDGDADHLRSSRSVRFRC